MQVTIPDLVEVSRRWTGQQVIVPIMLTSKPMEDLHRALAAALDTTPAREEVYELRRIDGSLLYLWFTPTAVHLGVTYVTVPASPTTTPVPAT